MNRCIATLIVGNQYRDRWERLCRTNWESYSRAIGSELIVITEPLDLSKRSASRSPAWQKLLVPQHETVSQFDQVAWVDSDILFNLHRPANLFGGVPLEKVGAVDSFGDPSPDENLLALKRYWQWIDALSVDLSSPVSQRYLTPDDIYSAYGEPVLPVGRMINAGVLVFSPSCHAEAFQFVYDQYDDRGNQSFYENVPLSYELVRQELVHWMDPRFNHLWAWDKILHYPFLHAPGIRSLRDKIMRRLSEWTGNNYEGRLAVRCATTALLNCHCLHFAGCISEMDLVDQQSASTGVIPNLGVY